MHRNTAILLVVLTLVTAFVMGIRVNRKLYPTPPASPNPSSVFANPSPTPVDAPQNDVLNHENADCGIAFSYPTSFQVKTGANATTLKDESTGEEINILCGASLPKPPLTQDKIETASAAGQQALVYHDASARTGNPIDVVMFTHPTNMLEVAVIGIGEVFNQLVASVRIMDNP